jgi:hypothetical protein
VPYEVFVPRARRPGTQVEFTIETADAIVREYMRQGFVLTVRQLYYQFVARDLIENTPAQYSRLVDAFRIGREAGQIDWEGIEDRSRSVVRPSTWGSPSDILSAAAQSYREDLWEGQTFRPEVWIEKDALMGVVSRACEELRVPVFATRGNASTSELYDAGRRFAAYAEAGLKPVVLHLADHDPNGIDMTRDAARRLELYARREVEVKRIALTMAQVRRHRPPPNFAKQSDSNLPAYVRQFGTSQCWELDALSPAVLDGLVRAELTKLIDPRPWKRAQARESRGRAELKRIARSTPVP